ncbi:MAG: hypothetical protein WKG32_20745 [Gemmatimonadaceae bacterium]
MPDNGAYYHAAYVAAGTILIGYALSVWWRLRAARRSPGSGAPGERG